MLIIFWFSSQPADEFPDFLDWDYAIKKTGHIIGYALLALSYSHIFGHQGRFLWLSWMLVIVYAMSDETHQSFIPGRRATIGDVLVFDNLGAVLGLWLDRMWTGKGNR